MNFVQEFFVNPFVERTGYNAVNTLVYGVLFIFFIYALFKFLKKVRVKIDNDFLKALVPFVILASVVRSLTDQGAYPYTVWTVTPGIYLTVTLVAITSLLVSALLQKKFGIKYHDSSVVIGSALVGSQLVLMNFRHWGAFAQIIGLFLLLTVPTMVLVKKFRIVFLNAYFPMLALLGQYWDAASTAVAAGFHGFWEQHVLTQTVFDLTGSAFSMIPIKIVAGILIVYAINRWEKNASFKNFLYFAMIMLGWGPGLRNALSVLALP